MEIERKFWLPKMPPSEMLGKGEKILQGYISTKPEVRLRRKEKKYFLTIKGEGKLVRMEQEIKISKNNFDALWPLTKEHRLEKIRHTIPYKKLQLEIDVYQGHLDGLIILECEFPDIESANNFTLPNWAKATGAIEVTNDQNFKNKHLATLRFYPPRIKS